MQVLYRGQETDFSAAIHSILAETKILALSSSIHRYTAIMFGPWIEGALQEIDFLSEDSEWRINPSDGSKSEKIEDAIRWAAATAYARHNPAFVIGPDPIPLGLDQVRALMRGEA